MCLGLLSWLQLWRMAEVDMCIGKEVEREMWSKRGHTKDAHQLFSCYVPKPLTKYVVERGMTWEFWELGVEPPKYYFLAVFFSPRSIDHARINCKRCYAYHINFGRGGAAHDDHHRHQHDLTPSLLFHYPQASLESLDEKSRLSNRQMKWKKSKVISTI